MMRVAPRRLGYGLEDLPAPITVDDADTRVLIAPANSAGQAHAWAKALRSPTTAAVNLDVRRRGRGEFPADFAVADAVFAHSRTWGIAHAHAVREHITHVLIESERAVLGHACAHDVDREASWFDEAGIVRAYVSHGSDIRDPDRHADTSPWSPFRDRTWSKRAGLVATARRNAAFLRRQEAPRFVTTPELLLDVPDARWLPNVVDPDQWGAPNSSLTSARLRVVHAPTDPFIKGTDLIEPAVTRLVGSGHIEYRRLAGVDPALMAAAYADADVVLDQFRIGIYSTTAVEAMASARLVLGFIAPEVREVAEREAGMPLPIVDANPETIDDVLRDIALNPSRYRARAEAGPNFVRTLHDGAYAARVLGDFLSQG